MKRLNRYAQLSWDHDLWSLLRYYRSLRLRGVRSDVWLAELTKHACLPDQPTKFPIRKEVIGLLRDYLPEASQLLVEAIDSLRSEEEAILFCKKEKYWIGSTATKNRSHHQSSKALIAAVSGIAEKACRLAETTVNLDPQRRAVWLSDGGMHASARNLDGAIPSLENPVAVWEIKEYWGKTKGGSKMSDAVYECHLVGLELRIFEDANDLSVDHIVFVDGKEQWNHRRSDLLRLIDLNQQGLVDHLVVGKEVETVWPGLAMDIARKARTNGEDPEAR